MKNTKKIVLSVLLALTMALSMVTTAFAKAVSPETAAEAGKTVKITFAYENVMNINGTITFSNPDMFVKDSDGNVEFALTASSSFMRDYNNKNGKFFCYNSEAEDCTLTLTLTLANTATVGDSCTITLEYESSEDGRMPSIPDYQYDTAVVTVKETVVVLDYSVLEDLIAEAEALDSSEYTDASWADLEEALEAAKALIGKAETQDQIKAAAKALADAIDALKPVIPNVIDYSKLEEQIAIAEALVEAEYTEDSWALVAARLEEAREALDSTSQILVNRATRELKRAIEDLVKMDYSALDAIIAEAEALNYADYTEQSWKNIQEALAVAYAAKSSRDQDTVDAAVEALRAAIDGRTLIDYKVLDALINAAEELDAYKSYYTADSWADLSAKLDTAKAARATRDQATVNEAAMALADAIINLEKLPADDVDVSILNALITASDNLNESDYTAASWASFKSALDAAVAALDSNDQNTVNDAVKDLVLAIAGLEKPDPNAGLDYTELLKKIGVAESLTEADYTADSWTALGTAHDAAIDALSSKDQSAINSATKALADAINALVKVEPVAPVVLDYADLLKQIGAAEILTKADYTAETWTAVETALGEANALVGKAETQDQIAAAATKLANAIKALAKVTVAPTVELDYTALSVQIGIAEYLTEADYTAETWVAVTEALGAAKALVNKAETQAEIDSAAKALEDAVKALEKVEVAPPAQTPSDDSNVWAVLFWISLGLDVVAIALIVVYMIMKKKKESDDTPLVDYSILDDEQDEQDEQ